VRAINNETSATFVYDDFGDMAMWRAQVCLPSANTADFKSVSLYGHDRHFRLCATDDLCG